MDYGFKQWLNQQITIEPYQGQTGAGDHIYGAPFVAACLISGPGLTGGGLKLVNTRTGETVTTTYSIYLDGNVLIDIKDKIHYENLTYPIKLLIPFYTDQGVLDYWEVRI